MLNLADLLSNLADLLGKTKAKHQQHQANGNPRIVLPA
jgi:hypothetical protein